MLRGLALWMFSFIGSPSTSMMDAIALAACDQDAQRWGDARIYGAIGWGMAHLPLGMMLDRYGFCVMFLCDHHFLAIYKLKLLQVKR